MRETSRHSSSNHPSSMIRPPARKRLIVAALENGYGLRPLNPIHLLLSKNIKHFPSSHHFPCGMKKVTALLEQWIKEDKKDTICLFHLKKGHTLEQCMVFRKILFEA